MLKCELQFFLIFIRFFGNIYLNYSNKEYMFVAAVSSSSLYLGSIAEAVKENCLFAFRYFQSPLTMGSLFPSSSSLAEKMVAPISISKDDPPKRILEVGPGVGTFTERMLKKIRPQDVLVLVEIDPVLCQVLEKKYIKHPNVFICQGSIETFTQDPFDGILSSLPHNQFDADFVKRVFNKYLSILKPGGFVTYYEYKYPKFFSKLFFRRHDELEEIRQIKAKIGKKFNETIETVWMNLPSANVRLFVNS
ncbi:MAG: class I SAM-dependent methyltransferase [Chlamydiia bacterium]